MAQVVGSIVDFYWFAWKLVVLRTAPDPDQCGKWTNTREMLGSTDKQIENDASRRRDFKLRCRISDEIPYVAVIIGAEMTSTHPTNARKESKFLGHGTSARVWMRKRSHVSFLG